MHNWCLNVLLIAVKVLLVVDIIIDHGEDVPEIAWCLVDNLEGFCRMCTVEEYKNYCLLTDRKPNNKWNTVATTVVIDIIGVAIFRNVALNLLELNWHCRLSFLFI